MSKFTEEQMEQRSEEFRVKLSHLCEQYGVAYIGSFVIEAKEDNSGGVGACELNGISSEKVAFMMDHLQEIAQRLMHDMQKQDEEGE